MASWRPQKSVLEAPGIDLGGSGNQFFEILNLLARKLQELISNLKLKLRNSSLELELAVLPNPASKFGSKTDVFQCDIVIEQSWGCKWKPS